MMTAMCATRENVERDVMAKAQAFAVTVCVCVPYK